MKVVGVNLVTSFFFAIIFSFAGNAVFCYDYPIIGILAQEQTDDVVRNSHPETTTYIYATYVKAVESTGARVAPIFPGQNESYYRTLLSSINGVILPGGNATISPGFLYYDAASIIYNIAIEFNQQGRYFPVFGVCLGFEFLMVYVSKNLEIQKNCNVYSELLPLRFNLPPKDTFLYKQARMNVFYSLQYENSTVNLHTWCTLADDFHQNPHLESEWQITATSTSYGNNIEFITSAEHQKYPIFAVQFHPEVVPYEWSSVTRYPRAENIILTNQYFYKTLVHHARKNNNTFLGKEAESEEALLIYNYPVYYTRYNTGKKRQMYLF